MNREDQIHRYVSNQMSTQEAEQFEEQFLFDEVLTTEVEDAMRMYNAFQAYGDSRPIESIQPVNKSGYWFEQPLFAWSLAATVMVFALPILVLLSGEDDDYIPIQLTNIDLSRLRSNEEPTIYLGNENTIQVLAIFVDRQIHKFNAETFEIIVTNLNDHGVVMRQGYLETDASNMLYINLQNIPTGRYKAEIYGSRSQQSKELLKRFTISK